jgi:DNA polymerase I-like protein with 3'-5' exonuclease and polymerase domains
MNVGLLLGQPSGGLVDVDLDVPEALAVARLLLPATGWVSGRKGSPRSHWWYIVGDPPEKAEDKFLDLDRTCLLELRSTGAQTVAPPGVHESGEPILWHSFGQPNKVDAAALREAVGAVAAATLLARHWPAKGARQDAFLALAGALLRAQWAQDAVKRFVAAVVVATRDEERRKRVQAVSPTAKKLQEGAPVTGWRRLEELLGQAGQEVVAKAREWLGIPLVPAGVTGSGKTKRPAAYRPLPPFQPLPLQALPPVLRDLVTAGAAAIGCDPALLAPHALAASAGSIGNSRSVRLKGGWVEPSVLWALTVADSGGHKTPAYRQAVDPLMDLQVELFEEHRQQMQEHKEELEEWQATPKDERGERPQPPPEPRSFITSDATIEALGELLRDNSHGLLLARDEMDAWFRSFTRYRQQGGNDRSQWLELHGATTLRIDRLTRERGRLIVPRAGVSLCGTIQPTVLAAALDDEALQAGLGARFLLTMPPGNKRVWTEAEVSEELVERYQGLLRDLLALPLLDEGRRRPHVLTLSPEARQLWVEFYNAWGEVQFDAEGEQRAAFAKVEAYVPRLALVHHIVSLTACGVTDCVPVTVASVQAAIELARWFADEAVRVYAMLHESEDDRKLRRLVEWIQRRGGRVTARQLQRSNSRRWPDRDTAECALEDLVRGGLGQWDVSAPSERGGHPMRRFQLMLPTPDTTDTCSRESDEDDGEAPDTCPDGGPGPAQSRDDDGGGNGLCTSVYGSDAGKGGDQVSVVSGVGNGFPTLDGRNGDGAAKGQVSGASVGRGGTGGAAAEVPYQLVTDPAGLAMVAAALGDGGRVGLDLETTGLDPRRDRIRLLSLGVPTIDGGHFAYLIDSFRIDPSPLFEALSGVELVIHNAAFDLAFLTKLGFVPGVVHDTLLLAQLLAAGTDERCSLAACVGKELGLTVDKALQASDWSGELSEGQLAYAARDVGVLAPLYVALAAKVVDADLAEAAAIERRCLPAVVWMARHGVALDKAAWQALAGGAAEEANRLREELDRAAPPRPESALFSQPWNWDSVAQARDALRLAGCELESTADEALAGLDHPLAALLRRYREARKRTGTYGGAWLKHVAYDGRVYPSWRQIGAASGRMACSSPNMQNLPRGDCRRCACAPPGRVLVKADYSQIELRIAAKISGDKALLEAYQRGEDLHARTARSVLGVAEVSREHRQLAKALNFGLVFGMGSRGFQQYAQTQYGVRLTLQEAGCYRTAFFRSYPGLAAWHRRVRGAKAPQTLTLTGRRRLLNQQTPDTHRLNTPVQGTGADGLKLALALLWECRDQCPGAFPVLAVHDEIVVECSVDQAEVAASWLRTAMMEAMAPLIDPVPVEVDVNTGPTWGKD